MNESETTITKEIDAKINDIKINNKTIKAPLFLLFAEYLGCISKTLDWIEDWVNGKEISDFKIQVINTDAKRIFNKIISLYPKDEVSEWYEEFYDVFLCDYDEKISNKVLKY